MIYYATRTWRCLLPKSCALNDATDTPRSENLQMMRMLDGLIAAVVPWMPRPIVQKVSAHYIAGERVEQAMDVVRSLNERGIRATIDVLGESVESFSVAEDCAQQYELVLDELDRLQLDSGISIKLTAFGLLLDRERCAALVRRVVDRARGLGRYVRVDMEDAQVTDATLSIFREMRAGYDRVGAVLQAYMRRTPDDATALVAEGADVRLCKGIYVEPQAIAWKHPDAVRRNYVRTLEILLRGKGHVGIATHDEVLVWEALELIRELEVPRQRYEFQALLGVTEELVALLLARGEPMRLYVPFGQAWFDYSMRRLRENPSIAGHITRDTMARSRRAVFGPGRGRPD